MASLKKNFTHLSLFKPSFQAALPTSQCITPSGTRNQRMCVFKIPAITTKNFKKVHIHTCWVRIHTRAWLPNECTPLVIAHCEVIHSEYPRRKRKWAKEQSSPASVQHLTHSRPKINVDASGILCFPNPSSHHFILLIKCSNFSPSRGTQDSHSPVEPCKGGRERYKKESRFFTGITSAIQHQGFGGKTVVTSTNQDDQLLRAWLPLLS